MKNLLIAVAFALSAINAGAQTLALWTFESTLPAGPGPFAPEEGSGTAISNGGGVFSNPVGNGSLESWSSNGWTIGTYYQFTTSVVDTELLAFTWDQTSSNTGPAEFDLQFSTNGMDFSPVASYTVTNDSWSSTTYKPESTRSYNVDVTGVAGDVTFRLINTSTLAVNGGTVAGTGTDRVDNVGITVVPEPATVGLLGLGAAAILFGIRRRRLH